jgi:hypothetical protein
MGECSRTWAKIRPGWYVSDALRASIVQRDDRRWYVFTGNRVVSQHRTLCGAKAWCAAKQGDFRKRAAKPDFTVTMFGGGGGGGMEHGKSQDR